MAVEVYANNPSTTVTSGGTDAPSAGTAETWVVASAASFPTASSTASPPTQFHVADPAVPSDLSTVTNTSGTTWLVTRGAEGTTPVGHASGFTVEQVVTAGGYAGFLTANSGYATTASPALTGSPTAPTQTAADNSTKIATTAFVTSAVATETTRAETAEGLKAPLVSPALTGNPTAPTQTAGDNSTKIATTAYVTTAVAVGGGNAATATNLAGGATFPAYIAPKVFTLTDGSSVPVNAALGNVARWPLAGSSHTLATPTSPVDGEPLDIRVIYSGAFTPLFSGAWDFTPVGGAPTWTATSGKVDEIGFRFVADAASGAGAWVCVGWVLGA